MNAAHLKTLARKLNDAAFAAGKADADDSRTKKFSEGAMTLRQVRMQALLDAIDAALPTLPAADTIILGAIETDEGSALSFTEVLPRVAPGVLGQTR